MICIIVCIYIYINTYRIILCHTHTNEILLLAPIHRSNESIAAGLIGGGSPDPTQMGHHARAGGGTTHGAPWRGKKKRVGQPEPMMGIGGLAYHWLVCELDRGNSPNKMAGPFEVNGD